MSIFNAKAAGLAVAVITAGCALTNVAYANVAGQLSCNIAGGQGFLISSTRNVACTFQSVNGPVQLYNGTISRLGLDVGAISGGRLTYQVLAIGNPVPGALQGSYIGSGASVTLGTGIGIDALVGGNGNTISLQPLATTISTGNNINAGLGALRLSFAGLAEPPMMRRIRHHRHYGHMYRHHHMG